MSRATEPITPVKYAGSDPVSFGISILRRTADNGPYVRSTFRITAGITRGAWRSSRARNEECADRRRSLLGIRP